MTRNANEYNAETKVCAFRDKHEDYFGKGYSCLPTHEKRPMELIGGTWRGLGDWTRFAMAPADRQTRARWAAMPGAGIGLLMGAAAGLDGAGVAMVVVGIDDDREGLGEGPDALGDAIRSLLPASPCKAGRKGCTWLARMRADEAKSFDYKGPNGTVQLLAAGKQTVVPPSIHPDTGRPYVWLSPLVPACELPTLRLADLDRAMKDHGYQRGAGKRENDPERYDAAAAEIKAGEVRNGLVAFIETAGGDLSDLWEHGAESEIMQRPTASGATRDRTGNGRRLTLARQMRRSGYSAAEFRAACWKWEHAEGANPVTERDSARAWADSAPSAGTASGFSAVVDDADESDKPPVASRSDRDRLVFMADEPLEAEAEELFKGLVPWGELGLFYGESGSGKSFLLMDFARAVATGTDFMGFENLVKKPLGVLIVAAEAHRGLRRRRKALVVNGMPGVAPLVTVALSDRRRLGEAVRGGAAAIAAMGAELRVVLIDTFGQFFSMKDENANAEMGDVVRDVLKIAREHRVMVVPVHHPAKDGKEPRGATALKNALDWACLVEGGFDLQSRTNKPRTVTLRKTKDGVAGVTFGFTIKSVTIGQDAAGEEITAGYVVPALGQAAESLPRWHSEILEALRSGDKTRADVRAAVRKMPGGAGISDSVLNKAIGAMARGGRITEAASGVLQVTEWTPKGGDSFGIVDDTEGMTVH